MLACPNCGTTLTTKTIKTNESGSIDVDLCNTCGGVYFDRGEVNRISKEDANTLSHTKTLPFANQGTNLCPKCGASLKRYWGESVPSDVYVLRCPDCSGAWLSQEDLKKFKTAQQAKINYFRTWHIPLSSLSTVLIPVALLVVLTGTTLITVSQINKYKSAQIQAKEMITAPSVIPTSDSTGVIIVFSTKEYAKTDILITGYEGFFGTTKLPVSDSPRLSHEITVPHLTKGKIYFYRIHVVTGEDSFYSEEFSFSLPN